MPHDWKPGDRAMVVIKEACDKPDSYWLATSAPWRSRMINADCLHPLPTSDQLTELERAVVDAALAVWEMSIGDGPYRGSVWNGFWDAVKALHDARQPACRYPAFCHQEICDCGAGERG